MKGQWRRLVVQYRFCKRIDHETILVHRFEYFFPAI